MTLSLLGCNAYHARWFLRIGNSLGVAVQVSHYGCDCSERHHCLCSDYPGMFHQNKYVMKKILALVFSFFVISAAVAQITIPTDTTVHWHPNTMPVINGDITLEEGAILYIHGCTLTMPDNSKILVEKNARLHVYNSQIKGTDPTGVTWEGIRCDKGTISGFDRIPYVNISDSEFSGAEIAFMNATDESSNNWGGAIVATNVDFVNNKIFLILKNYHYGQRSWEHARFTKCKFRELSTCYTAVRFIYLEDVYNVVFQGCEFLNNCSPTTPRVGIIAYDSKFSLTGHCSDIWCNQKTPNQFHNKFNPSIQVDNNPNSVFQTVTIADCIFEAWGFFQVRLNGCVNAHVYSNVFNLQSHQTDEAIRLYDCPVFWVEDNTITFSGNQTGTYGIVVQNSGDKTNTLYRNTINNAEVGIQAIGRNRKNTTDPWDTELGLKFLCNTITSYNEAYYIDVCQGIYSQGSGIVGVSRFQQGALNGQHMSPNFNQLHARSLFGPPAPENDFRNIPVGNTDVNYVVPFDATPQFYGIQYVTGNITIDNNNPFSKNDPHCETRTPCFGPDCPVEGPSPITSVFPQFYPAKSQLEELVNGGDYEGLMELVSGVSQENVENIFDTLMHATPSADILALACGNDLFTSAMVTSLLIENSYGIKFYEVREALEMRDNPLEGSQMEEIYAAAASISEYEALLMAIEQMVMEYSNIMNRDLYYLANRDTIPLDSIRDYLAVYNDFLSIIRLIQLEFSEGNTNEAHDWYEHLQGFHDNPDQLEGYNLLFDDILSDVYENLGGDFTQLTSTQVETLETLAAQTTYAAGSARYILTRHFDYTFESYVCPANRCSQRKRPDSKEVQPKGKLLVYPNPAHHSITIVSSVDNSSVTTIEIFDMTGKRLLSRSAIGNVTDIDVSSLKQGYYVIRLFSGSTVLSSSLIIN